MLESPHGSKEVLKLFASDGHVFSKKIFCGHAKLLWVVYGTHVFAPIPFSLFSFFSPAVSVPNPCYLQHC